MTTEAQEQTALVRWFSMQYPHLRGRLVASANGAYLQGNSRQRAVRAGQMLAQGMAPGFPDLFLPVPSKGKHGLFIEMKRAKGGVVSGKQKEWITWLNEMGYEAHVCRGSEEAMKVIEAFLA